MGCRAHRSWVLMPVGLLLYTLTGEAQSWSHAAEFAQLSHLLHFLCCSLSSGCVEPVINSFKPHTFFVNYNSTRISFFSWNTHPLSHIIYQLAPISLHLLQEALLDSSSPGVRSLLNALITSCVLTYPTPVKRGASFFSTECNAWHINGCSTMLVK